MDRQGDMKEFGLGEEERSLVISRGKIVTLATLIHT